MSAKVIVTKNTWPRSKHVRNIILSRTEKFLRYEMCCESVHYAGFITSHTSHAGNAELNWKMQANYANISEHQQSVKIVLKNQQKIFKSLV